jgi:hypothetical protein
LDLVIDVVAKRLRDEPHFSKELPREISPILCGAEHA